MLPRFLEELIPKAHPVRVVSQVVDSLVISDMTSGQSTIAGASIKTELQA